MLTKDQTFKTLVPFEDRKATREKIIEKRPHHIPIICEKDKKSSLKDLPKSK